MHAPLLCLRLNKQHAVSTNEATEGEGSGSIFSIDSVFCGTECMRALVRGELESTPAKDFRFSDSCE